MSWAFGRNIGRTNVFSRDDSLYGRPLYLKAIRLPIPRSVAAPRLFLQSGESPLRRGWKVFIPNLGHGALGRFHFRRFFPRGFFPRGFFPRGFFPRGFLPRRFLPRRF